MNENEKIPTVVKYENNTITIMGNGLDILAGYSCITRAMTEAIMHNSDGTSEQKKETAQRMLSKAARIGIESAQV